MAVSIMSACCRASVLCLYLLACSLQVLSQGEVFRRAPQANSVLLRSRRANMFLLEEILKGNLERECYEELCNFEEAREYFEDNEKTIAFWTVYYDGDQCQPNPCLHGGNCTDKVGGFHCSCHAPRRGPVCELGAPAQSRKQLPSAQHTEIPEIAECPTEGPKACHQLCTVSHHSFTCSCMSGFKLQSDKRTCSPEVEFACGRLPSKFNTTASMCRHGNCPWQVTLQNSRGVELCGGVVLGRRSVLTAATCLLLDSGPDLRPSNFLVVTGNKLTVPVQALMVHDRFRADHHDNNLALLQLASPLPFGPALIHICLPTKDFSENILMHSGRTGVVEEQGGRPNQDLVYMMLDECRSQVNVSHPLSNKMFCMRRQSGGRRSPNGPTGNHSDSGERTNRPLGRRHGPVRNNYRALSPSGRVGKQNGAQTTLSKPSENQNGTQGRPNGPTVIQNQTHNNDTGAENHNSSISKIQNEGPLKASGLRSEVRVRRCGGLLVGSPVATEEQGTAFLTGLMILSSPECNGSSSLVFIKLSRYLNWIKPRLEATEAQVMPQVRQYPEIH
ncbi:protein Z, vitamin K-dependent plasma glycoprotein b [Mastacembelus armatus]|uniref:Coagulation factor II (thrombin) n=1 Tax=Mastacembelus armatus TaxID=205130 RepID=A0A3Q3N1L6_9TELE|nr:vitamin K-dependent protein Z-like [Mastacembelus armatus]